MKYLVHWNGEGNCKLGKLLEHIRCNSLESVVFLLSMTDSRLLTVIIEYYK